jgi:hypothetical protein
MKKVIKTFKDAPHFFQKVFQAIYEKKQYYFSKPYNLNIRSRDHFWTLVQ